MTKRQRGRPRNKDGTIPPWQFARAAAAMCAFDEARGSNQKHSAAVKYAVEVVKQGHPEMAISQTEVKRILAAYRPRNAGTILRFERSVMTEEDRKRFSWIREQLAALRQKKGLVLAPFPSFGQAGRTAVFKFGFAERPEYPRYNRKKPQKII